MDPPHQNSRESGIVVASTERPMGTMLVGENGVRVLQHPGNACVTNSEVTKDSAAVFSSPKRCAIVLSSALLFLVASNSTMWYVHDLWKACGSFWQQQWELMYDLFGGDEDRLATLGTILVPTLVYWLVNGSLLVMDMTGRPAALLKYRIQENTVPVDPVKLRKAIPLAMFNLLVVTGFLIYLFGPAVIRLRGMSCGRELPPFRVVLVELVVSVIVMEVMFYYSHRFLHLPMVYRRVHKLHHEWTAPIGAVAFYCHPVEHVLSNVLPGFAGPILMGSHVFTMWFWICLTLTSTSIAHSGYHFPLLPSPEAHDFHHVKFNQCYGFMGTLDLLHGTDERFRRSRAADRHVVLLGLTPLSRAIPDQPKIRKAVSQN